jgi:hypothetical protein
LNLIFSCQKREIKYEFYDMEEKILKSEGEYLNGVLDGVLTYYYPDGKKRETSEWSHGTRNGITIAYFPSGKIGTEYSYRMGKANGVKIYHENGHLKYVGQIDENKIFYNAKNYDEAGKLLEMEPSIKYSTDTLSLGDTLLVVGSLSNVIDTKYRSGEMMLGIELFEDLQDSLQAVAVTSSDSNVYRISMVPKKRGTHQIIAQISFPGDSLAFFSSSFRVVVK